MNLKIFFMHGQSCLKPNSLVTARLAQTIIEFINWLVGFVALRPKSTAIVIAGRSVHLTTLFPGQA